MEIKLKVTDYRIEVEKTVDGVLIFKDFIEVENNKDIDGAIMLMFMRAKKK